MASTYPPQIENGVYAFPLHLEAALETQRAVLENHVLAAQKRLRTFAQAHEWAEHVEAPFAQSTRIYANKTTFDHDLLDLCGLDPALELPSTYCAALEQGVLMSVSPDLYRAVYPEGDEPDAFEKLLTHEMAHRLHIRILHGDEEAMGPVWFYEGFALFAAEQLTHVAPTLTETEIWEVVEMEERIDYRRYVTVFRYFLEKVPLPQLVEMAGKAEFADWLRSVVA